MQTRASSSPTSTDTGTCVIRGAKSNALKIAACHATAPYASRRQANCCQRERQWLWDEDVRSVKLQATGLAAAQIAAPAAQILAIR